ncbi:MAG: thioredoxin 1 [Candidatus Saganbacteria bacterium]|uniref:Thioredoxin 1 n=1 Tax=Candidatus Saganbacteria bacterium TaxID=2575572 RepID=A0A833NXZ0_UNCSA|nr:MAG: thioredoxin 1 [Candidatus Saganbacteria bacterium]
MRNKLLAFVFFICLSSLGFAAIASNETFGLNKALKSNLPVIVKLGADWCYPCREMKPILIQLAKDFGDKAIFLDLDINKYRELAKEHKVMLIPTTLFYNNQGKFIYKHVGFINRDQIIKILKKNKMVR